MENTNIINNDDVTENIIQQPNQELKKRQIPKKENDEDILNNTQPENEQGEGEKEEEEDSEYEYEFAPTTGFYIVVIGAILAIIAFIIFINLNYSTSKSVKSWLIGSLIDFKNQFFLKKVYIVAICSFIFFQIATAISDAIIKHFKLDSTNSNNKDLNDLSSSSIIGAFIIVGIIFPIGEELVFRKLIYGLVSLLSNFLAYIISSFLFAFYHFEFSIDKLKEEIARFPLYLLAGVMFAFVYDYTGCILTSIIAHILNNSKTVILSLVGVLND